MDSDAEIIKKLKALTASPIQAFPAVVLSVDEDEMTALVQPKDQAEMSVRLKSAEDASQEYFILVPRVQSVVLITLIQNDEDEGVLLRANEIDKLLVRIGDRSLEMTSEHTLFNGGENGGLININSLKTEYEKTKASVDSLLQIFSDWVVTPSDGGAALKVLATAQLTGKETGSFDSITDDKIKH